METISTSHHGYFADKVDAVAADLQAADECGWTYTVRHDLNDTFSLIAMHDEDGEFVAYY